MDEKKDNRGTEHNSGRGYMLRLLSNIVIATVVTLILEVFLVTNVTSISGYLYQTGNDSLAVQRFAFGSTVSVLLFVFLGILIFAVILLLLQRRTARDIESIRRAVEQISDGDLTTKLEVSEDSEFTNIAANIGRMENDIRALIGYLDLLRKKKNLSPEMRQKYVDIAYQKSQRLQKLIEELFGFTKLSYGHVNLNIKELDIVELVAQLLEESYPNFAKNGLSYEFISSKDHQTIEADADLLARLFDNLINNAIKYGKEGKRVNVRLRTDQDSVTVKIVNYGYVIPEKELPLIFDRFYRTDHSRTNANGPGGTGLGLAIVKNITDMHHGTVSVASDLSGTVFTVKLPIHYEEEKEKEDSLEQDGKRK